jgi:hypothetical protein
MSRAREVPCVSLCCNGFEPVSCMPSLRPGGSQSTQCEQIRTSPEDSRIDRVQMLEQVPRINRRSRE